MLHRIEIRIDFDTKLTTGCLHFYILGNMRFTKISSIVGATFLASASLATPLPQNSVTVQGFGQSDISQICGETLNSDGSNSVQVWVNSGASFFLDNFIKQNGESNWVNVLDQKTTDGGKQGISNLDCTDLTGGNCAFPTVQCKFFTPPAVFFIRQAVATAYAVLQSMQNNLFSSTFVQSLGVDQIASDFGLAPLQGDAGLLSAISGGFSVASGLATPVPALAAILDLVSGILGIVSGLSNPPDAPPSVSLALDQQLSQIFTEENSALVQTATSAFGGSGAIQLPGVGSNPGPNNEVTTPGKFLSGGKYLIPVTSQGSIDSMLQPTFDASSQILVRDELSTVNFSNRLPETVPCWCCSQISRVLCIH
jgi:hypothetical protein